MTGAEWMKSQLGVWNFSYDKRDIRDKKIHPAVFPIQLVEKVIQLFTHKGELVVDPFVGVGTVLLAAKEQKRNALGCDINSKYIEFAINRIGEPDEETTQILLHDDARNLNQYLSPETVKLVITSPPYANLLNRERKNKSRRADLRQNDQFGKIEQYSQEPRDLGLLDEKEFQAEFSIIFKAIYPYIKPNGHCVINVTDYWMDNERIPLHINIVNAMNNAGYKLRNTIIWDRRNIVNNIGIFGYPSNYITMGTTFEYLLDFIKR
jgi:DNA modification methylase